MSDNFGIYIDAIKNSMDKIQKQFAIARELCSYLDREYENCKHEGNKQAHCKYKPDVYCKMENCPFLR